MKATILMSPTIKSGTRPSRRPTWLWAFSLFMGILVFSPAQAKPTKEQNEKLHVLIRVFQELGSDFGLYLEVSAEIEAFLKAGLDSSPPITSRGLDAAWLQKSRNAFNISTGLFNLMDTGISKKQALFVLDCAKKKNLKIGEEDYPRLLFHALRETGQEVDSLIVDKAVRAALILSEKGKDRGLGAYSTLGIDIKAIPSLK